MCRGVTWLELAVKTSYQKRGIEERCTALILSFGNFYRCSGTILALSLQFIQRTSSIASFYLEALMSYLVLARKWRPQKFEDVINQKHVVLTLQNALKTRRLANAYLFTGPRGIGKTTIARILAKSINCERGISPTPCNECDSCRDITESRSLDVLEIDGASNRGIDEIRNLRESLKYAPNPGKHKIYIIDEVHMLTNEAFNALLKTLEEPPTRVMFIFATTEPHKVPATIISRCQRFDFKRISINEIISHLKHICEQEKIDIDDEALFLIARKAEGGMRDSQSLLDQAISFCGSKITSKDIIDLLGIIEWEIFFNFTDYIISKKIKEGLNLVETVFFNGYDLVEFLSGLSEHFRNILMVKATGSINFIEASDNYKKRYQEISTQFEEPDLLQLIQIASDAQYTIKRSSNPRIFMEMVVMKMIRLTKTQSIETIIQGIESLKEKVIKGGKEVAAVHNRTNVIRENYQPSVSTQNHEGVQQKIPTVNRVIKNNKEKGEMKEAGKEESEDIDHSQRLPSPDSQSDIKLDLQTIKARWQEFVEEIKRKRIAFGSFLEEGIPNRFENNTLTLEFGLENGFHVSYLEKNRRDVEKIMSNLLGTPIRLQYVKKILNNNNEEELSGSDYYLEKLGQKIPIIKTIVDVFDVELIK